MVMVVMGEPYFAYTIGIWHTFDAPEFFIVGLSQESLHTVCNSYGEAVREGWRPKPCERVADWLEGEEVELHSIADGWKEHYLGIAADDYGTTAFPAVQGIWSSEGAFPNEDAWPERLVGTQFMLFE